MGAGFAPTRFSLVGISQKGSPERCRFRFLSIFFRFLFSSFFPFPFFLFLLFFQVPFFFVFSFLFPFSSVSLSEKKKRGDTIRETLFAKPRRGENFHSRPGRRQKSLVRSSGVGVGGQNRILNPVSKLYRFQDL